MTDSFHIPFSGSRALCIWMLLLLLPGGLAADEGDDASAPPQAAAQPLLYETATVRARPISRATASVTVLERETIESLDMASVAELIRFVAGVNVASTGPRGGVATALTRGGDPNYTTVLLDGIPLNDITDQVGGAFNLNSLSTAHIERIEVVRGPLSSFFGPIGLAGAINIVTRQGATTSPAWSFGVAAGDDSTVLTSAALSQGTAERNYFVGLTWEQAEDEIDAVGPTGNPAEDKFEQFGLQANARFPIGERVELRLTGRFATGETTDYPEGSGGILLGSGETRESETDDISLGAEVSFGSAEQRHKIYATGYRHKLDRTSPAIGFVVPPSVEDTTYVTWQLGWTAPQIEFWNSRLNLGVDGRVEDGESNSVFAAPPPFDDAAFRIDRRYGGGFAEWLVERGRTLIEVGARIDVVEGSDTEFSPRVGLFYLLPGDKTRLRASVGRAFKLPSFFALSVPIFGNPDLLPETVIGVDSGVEHTFKSIGLTTTLTLFYNQFEDLVTFDGATFTFVNVPELESQGAELTVDWQASERILVHANVTYEDFDDPGSTSPLTHRPEWFGAASFIWRITERTRWVLDGQWVSEAFDFEIPLIDPPNSFGTELTSGYQLFGTAVSVKVAERWEVHARVDNLADKEYEPFIGFPGPDRSFRVGVRYRSR